MDQLAQELEPIFYAQNRIELQALLQPISADSPAGESLFGGAIYQKIQEARTQDDNSTPRGVWELELRQADWNTVYQEALNAIQNHSKDVQLAVWFLEAQTCRLGFGAIAPSIQLISKMLETFWGSLYPQASDGELEHRINVFEWLNMKLAITLKQIPLTQRADTDRQYNWADWELALHHSQIQNAHPEVIASDQEHDLDAIALNINLTPIEYYQQLYSDIELALLAVDELSRVLDEKLANDSPSLAGFTSVLEDVAGMAYQQLDQRGRLPMPRGTEVPSEETQEDSRPEHIESHEQGLGNRNDAYAALQSIADYLKVDDPHSPAPYLIYKAIDWGRMNTTQLYNELFVQQQGQLNIFELLGIEASANESVSHQ